LIFEFFCWFDRGTGEGIVGLLSYKNDVRNVVIMVDCPCEYKLVVLEQDSTFKRASFPLSGFSFVFILLKTKIKINFV